MRRMGRPGLVGTVARTAVIAGTASATAGAVNRRQQGKADEKAQAQAYQDQQQQMAYQQQMAPAQAAPAPAEPAEDPTMTKLKELGELHKQGILTDEEFAAAKAKALCL
jgi:Short C-terminal domain/Domain of unknwon function (DUF3824)